MRQSSLRLVFTLALIPLSSCQSPAATFSKADLDAAEAAVATQLEAFWDAWGTASFDQGMAFYSDDPDMTFVDNGFVWESKAAIIAAYRPYFEALEKQEANVTETRIVALSPEVVQVTQAVTFIQFFKDGTVGRPMVSAVSLTWVLAGGEWQAMTYHFSTPNPTPTARKSVTLLNLPPNATEGDLVGMFSAMNAAIQGMGYQGAGYGLWKAGGAQIPDATPLGFDYLLEGMWPDQATYDAIHEAEAYTAAAEEGEEIWNRIAPNTVYSRFDRIDMGGPGGR
ncbi:MAG: nuclear transport factor 2 family protein [Gemmatimonadota bacterium]